ncbi:MAG: hypothetical protein MRY71_13385 [Algiphilus sp.]|uniref:hypothetical protein n=1 Tax=Algiphilus sp. TaxID=1872431 RepID=UPI0025BBE4DB|nr:hypothetical protein [Algiphilus sp.]MCI5063928.1 hypothetical protein [Algiphilus sp.]MCI5103432.1 hypothetical protein [Algiphilus sp.]
MPVSLIQRGNNGRACFYADEDYRFYLDWFGKHAAAQGSRIHAFVKVTNHVHLWTSEDAADAVGKMMKGLGQRYAEDVVFPRFRFLRCSNISSAQRSSPPISHSAHNVPNLFESLSALECVSKLERHWVHRLDSGQATLSSLIIPAAAGLVYLMGFYPPVDAAIQDVQHFFVSAILVGAFLSACAVWCHGRRWAGWSHLPAPWRLRRHGSRAGRGRPR